MAKDVRFQFMVEVGHTAPITTLALSRDEAYIVSGGMDGTARLWDAATGRELHTFNQSRWVTSVAISADSRHIAAGNLGETVPVWDIESHKMVTSFAHPMTTAVAFTPDRKQVLTGGWGGNLRLWSVETGKEVRHYEGMEAGVASHINAVAISPDGKFVAACNGFNSAYIWSIATAKQVRELIGHQGKVLAIAFSPDGRQILTGSEDKTGRLWDAATGKELKRLKGHTDRVVSVAFSSDRKRAVTGGHDKTVRLWDLEAAQQIGRVEGTSEVVENIALFRKDQYILTVDQGNSIRLHGLGTGKDYVRFGTESSWVSSVRPSLDGERLLVGYDDGTARLWDLLSGREFLRVDAGSTAIDRVAFFPRGDDFFTGTRSGAGQIWSATNGEKGSSFPGYSTPFLGFMASRSVDLSPDGTLVATASDDHSVGVWSSRKGDRVATLRGHTDHVFFVGFSPDSKEILTISLDGTARSWDPQTGKPSSSIRGAFFSNPAAAFSPDGRSVALSDVRDVLLWDPVSNGVRRIGEHDHGITSFAFSEHGGRLLSGSMDRSARLWNVAAGGEVLRLEGHTGTVSSVTFLPPRKHRPTRTHLVTASQDLTVRIWDVEPSAAPVRGEVPRARERCRLVSFRGGWAVFDPEGRFDTNNLDEITGIHWLASDEPLRPLSAEIFMRDYYEPRLLRRVLDGETFRDVRSLAGLDRAQPVIQVTQIKAGSKPGTMDVTVEVDPFEGKITRRGAVSPTRSVHDLRLFRDRQLVGQEPTPAAGKPPPDGVSDDELEAWAAATLVRPGGRVTVDARTGHQTVRFEGVRLPSVPGRKVDFTAYAFNADRVKSTDGSARYEVPGNVSPARPRAYLVAFGVAGFSDPDWDLRYSAADARLVATKLGKALSEAGHFEVVPVLLATDRGAAGSPPRPGEAAATVANLKAVLDALAGRQADARALAAVPNAGRLAAATPDDLVVLFASAHGFTDTRGAYYIFPQDIGKPRGLGRVVTPDLLDACVSSGELSAWLRDVDAGQFALIVDCCHAASTVEQPGFKPGPMGSRGLGQLAYDKAMRVLAASQADDVALEALVKGEGHGLLTYALVREGLMENGEARGGVPRTLGGLLRYAEGRVPKLYAEVLKAAEGNKGVTTRGTTILVTRGGELVPLGDNAAPPESTLRKEASFQTPSLFDYARGRDVNLSGKR
jgi:WD40 repeat protein